MRLSGRCVMLLVFAAPVYGNEEDIFEVDDFLDPRELGAELSPNGSIIFGGQFRFFDLGAGHVWNYQDRTTFTDEDKAFLSVGYHKYWGNSQLNHRVTVFEDAGNTVRYRIKSEYAKYRIRSSGVEDDDAFVIRNKVSLVVDDSSGDGVELEVTGSMFVQTPPIPGTNLLARGGLSGSYRWANGENIYRVMFNPSSNLGRFRDGTILINGGFWVGYERSDAGSRFIPVRGKLNLDYRINSRMNMHLFYGPAYQSGEGNFESRGNQEAGLMLYYAFGTTFKRGF